MILALSLGLVLLLTFGSNPVYSILTLISSSLCLGLILLTYGLQFVSFLIVLIYIGAVSVLFLFVVMMINFRLNLNQFPLTETFVFWLLSSANFVLLTTSNYQVVKTSSTELTNFESLGTLLYQTNEVQLLLIVSLVLFVAMIGAISLTYIASENYRTQHIPTQTTLQVNKSYRLISRSGIPVSFLGLTVEVDTSTIFIFVLVLMFGVNVFLNYCQSTLLQNKIVLPSNKWIFLIQVLYTFLGFLATAVGPWFFILIIFLSSILVNMSEVEAAGSFSGAGAGKAKKDFMEFFALRNKGKIAFASAAGALAGGGAALHECGPSSFKRPPSLDSFKTPPNSITSITHVKRMNFLIFSYESKDKFVSVPDPESKEIKKD